MGDPTTCGTCGALLGDPDRHVRWHSANAVPFSGVCTHGRPLTVDCPDCASETAPQPAFG